MKNKINKNIKSFSIDWLGYVLPILLLVIWYEISDSNVFPSYKVPSLNSLWRQGIDFIFGFYEESAYSQQLVINLTASIKRVGIGFFLAAITGISFGFITGRVSIIRRLIDPMINAIRAIPGIGWLPLAIIWFGVGEKNTVFLMSLAAFFPIYLNTQNGAMEISDMTIKAGRMLGATGIKLFNTIIFPAAFPSVVVGLRTGLGVSWSYLVLGEITGVNKGLGAIMSDGRMLGNVEIVIICMFIIAILGKLTDWLLLKICALFYPIRRD